MCYGINEIDPFNSRVSNVTDCYKVDVLGTSTKDIFISGIKLIDNGKTSKDTNESGWY